MISSNLRRFFRPVSGSVVASCSSRDSTLLRSWISRAATWVAASTNAMSASIIAPI
jgi:hypothetical protein